MINPGMNPGFCFGGQKQGAGIRIRGRGGLHSY